MGVYLSSPNKTKETVCKLDTKYKYAASSMQGWRTTMEDAHIAHVDDEK